jgi:hypothetical protein
MTPSWISGTPTLALSPEHAEVGAQRELEAAAERVAGDRRDDRLGQPRHDLERLLQPTPQVRMSA